MIRIILIALVLTSSLSYGDESVWLGPDRRQWPETEFRKTKNDFAAFLLVTPDVDWEHKWNTPPDTVPHFREAKTAKVGEELVILTFFVNPKTHEKHNVKVQCSLKVTRPDNTIAVQQQGISCMTGALQGSPHNVRLSPAVLKFVGDKSDPLGKWVVDVQVEDVNRKTKLELKTHFELVAKGA